MSQMRTPWTLSQKLPEKERTQTIPSTSQKLATHEENHPVAKKTKD